MTVILPCSCKHKFQDGEYGSGMRLHNRMFKDQRSSGKARCSVCEKVHETKKEKEVAYETSQL